MTSGSLDHSRTIFCALGVLLALCAINFFLITDTRCRLVVTTDAQVDVIAQKVSGQLHLILTDYISLEVTSRELWTKLSRPQTTTYNNSKKKKKNIETSNIYVARLRKYPRFGCFGYKIGKDIKHLFTLRVDIRLSVNSFISVGQYICY